MIKDADKRAEIGSSWTTVRRLCKDSHRSWQIPGGGFISETPPEELYNLPFVLAYAVLDDVLRELLDQRTFVCKNKGKYPPLGQKIEDSYGHLPWQDYWKVVKGKCIRNELAHKARLLRKPECLAYVQAIEVELKAWGVL